MNKNLQKKLKNWSELLNESVVSMLLGALVVILLGLLAFNYFKNHQATNPVGPTETQKSEETLKNELTGPASAVNLPATYTVVSGDTLWSIAEKYYSSGYNYMDIAKANNITDSTKLEVGQQLTIPVAEVHQPLTVNTNLQPTVTVSRIDGTSYTVVKGDNLWLISVRAYGDGFKWPEISKANNLVNPNLIHAGNVFVIPR